MADLKLKAVIEAEDQASATLKKIEGNLGGFKKSVDNMKPAFTAMATVGTAVFASLSGVIFKSLQAADEAAKVQAQLGAVLKSTGGIAGVTADAAIKLSKSLQEVTTFGDEAILSAENMLLTFTSIGKEVFPEATKTVLDMSVALGQDTKSSAIQLGKALNDPIIGVTALQRVGVRFTDSQKEMIKTLVDSGKKMEAQKLILKELNIEFGGSATEAAKTFGGAMTQLKEKVGDAMEAIGNSFIPIIQSLTEKLKPVIDKVIAWAEANPELIKKIFEVGLAVSGLVAVMGFLGLILPAIITGFTILFSPISLIVIAIGVLVGLLVFFRERLKEIFDEIDQKTGLITLLKDAWDQISSTFTNFLLPALKELWKAIEPLKPFLDAMVKVVGGMLVIAIGAIILAIKGWVQILTLLVTEVTKVATFLTNVFGKSLSFIIDKLSDAFLWAQKLIDKIKELNIIQGAKNVLNKIGDKVTSALGINDGIVQNGQVISTHPEDTIIAMKQPGKLNGGGGAINININGAVLTQEAARIIGDSIVDQLRFQMKF